MNRGLRPVDAVLMQVVRARREQQVLAQAFGCEYAAYRASTWF